MSQHQQELMVNWLKDAYATEMSILPVLENHARDAKDYPQVQTRLQQHVEETRRHADMVRSCIERHGEDVSSLKTMAGSVFGMIKELPMAVSKDELVKNALSDYATEHFEIASYRALIATAQIVGDQETIRICQEILRDEEAQAQWLEQQLPSTVSTFLTQQERSIGS